MKEILNVNSVDSASNILDWCWVQMHKHKCYGKKIIKSYICIKDIVGWKTKLWHVLQ